jgi:hypothetical protein
MTECIVSKIVVGPKYYSRMRSEEHKCLEFGVSWEDGDFTTEPIHNLIDLELETVTEQLIPILRQYLEVVKHYPGTRRKCWLCDCKCSKGESLCWHHCQADKALWLPAFLAKSGTEDAKPERFPNPWALNTSPRPDQIKKVDTDDPPGAPEKPRRTVSADWSTLPSWEQAANSF